MCEGVCVCVSVCVSVCVCVQMRRVLVLNSYPDPGKTYIPLARVVAQVWYYRLTLGVSKRF